MSKKYEAMVLSCMDPRFQKPVHQHLKNKNLTGKFSAFTIAGGSIGVTNNKFRKWHSTFWENLETSINLPNKIFEKIFDCFDRYNFTVEEEQPLEKEVAKVIGKSLEPLPPAKIIPLYIMIICLLYNWLNTI